MPATPENLKNQIRHKMCTSISETVVMKSWSHIVEICKPNPHQTAQKTKKIDFYHKLASLSGSEHQLVKIVKPYCMYTVQVVTREEVFMEGPLELNMGPSLADVLLCTFEVLMHGFLHLLWENFCPGSNYSSPTVFSLKWNPATSGQHREVNNTR